MSSRTQLRGNDVNYKQWSCLSVRGGEILSLPGLMGRRSCKELLQL